MITRERMSWWGGVAGPKQEACGQRQRSWLLLPYPYSGASLVALKDDFILILKAVLVLPG